MKDSKIQIIGKDGLFNYLKEDNRGFLHIKTRKSWADQEHEIRKQTFRNFHFSKDFKGLIIKNCKFYDCEFENIFGFFLIFKKCKFFNCRFVNSRFSHGQFGWDELEFNDCYFRNVEIDEGDLSRTFFNSCHLQGLQLLGMECHAVHFTACHIENSQFQGLVSTYEKGKAIQEEYEDLLIGHCEILYCYFSNTDLTNSSIIESTLYMCAFVDCVLNNHTIEPTEKGLHPNYASMDFQTILKSDLSNVEVLKKYFNIGTSNIKEAVGSISTELNLRKIFISYSFKDRAFAKRIAEGLLQRGLKTFFWENDAPGGEPLEDIMTKNVRKHDRILFIASEDSIKSKACQFELTEGRRRQEETWETLFYPIHIDSFLFTVKKNQIRPIE
ncbi:MAG TPA: TIR domain-containing protein, partial [Sphingobacteriaceae bacterium]